MTDKVLSKGHVGTRIAWVSPVCNIFFIVVYISLPRKGRKQKSMNDSRHDHTTETTAVISTKITVWC